MNPLTLLNNTLANFPNEAYDFVNAGLSRIPGFTSPRYPGGGTVDTSKPRTGETAVEPRIGQQAVLGGKDVLWAGPAYKYQTPGSYQKLFGALPATFKPTRAAGSQAMPRTGGILPEETSTAPADASSSTAATAAQPPAGATPVGEGLEIPQTQEPLIAQSMEMLKRLQDPEYLKRIGEDRARRLLAAEFVTSELRGQREKAKYAKEVEVKNIESWRDLQVAATEANAREAVAFASTIGAAMMPNTALAAAMTQQYQAAMAPFNARRG